MKRCSRCGELKQESEFHKDKTHKDGLRSICKSCHKRSYTEWKSQNRDKVTAYHQNRLKSGQGYLNELKRPCRKCGEDRLYLLQFHHIDPSTKNFTLGSSGVFKNIDKIASEAKKCVCLCANCHTEYHWLYGKQPERPVETLTEYLGENPYEI